MTGIITLLILMKFSIAAELHLTGACADTAIKLLRKIPAYESNMTQQAEIISNRNIIIQSYSNDLNYMSDQAEFLRKQIPSEKKKRFTRGYVIASTGYIVIDIILTALIFAFGGYK